MDGKYLLGVGLAILSGCFFQFGLVLQKKVVNEIPREAREQRFMRTLLKRPLWITGFVLEFGLGSIAFMLAQDLIGPALVPGLMASGLIILAIGSVQINRETLTRAEVVGIGLMIFGILSLGLSQLGISIEVVREALTRSDTVRRITFFSSVLLLLWTATHVLSLRDRNRKGIIMAFSNGFPFSLSNFWVSPLLAVIFLVLGGKGSFGQVVIFVLASVILVGANVLGVRQTQEAFKFAQASNVIPVQQVSIQISPILVYFYVFSLTPPSRISTAYMIGGVLLIIVSGFLLGRRQSQIEAIE
jgi:drug/metabolite transporter (DMT)-like permease